jgi:hypothetical protein
MIPLRPLQALTLLGMPDVTVCHGSMTESAADPTLPMETG